MFLGSSTKLSEWLHKTYTVMLTRVVDYIDAFSFLVHSADIRPAVYWRSHTKKTLTFQL